MSNFPILLGQSAYLTRGLNDNWSPADGRLNILYPPPKPPMETAEVIPPTERGDWDYPVITLHDDAQSLLTELLPYKVVNPSAEADATHVPAGALVLGAARNDDALEALSKTIGVDLLNPDFGYALVKISRADGEVSHQSHPGKFLIYSRPLDPGAYQITPDFRTAMSRLRHAGIDLPEGWPDRYDMEGVEKTLEFQRTYGTHYVSKVAVGDTILQVFAYPPDKFERVKNAYENQPEKLSGPDAVSFRQFTTDRNTGEYGYVKEYGNILNLSNCTAFQSSMARGEWLEPTWSQQKSVFALFDSNSPLSLGVLDRDFQDQTATMVTLASLVVLIEYKRGLYWQRVLKAALAQKYQGSIQVDVRVSDPRDFEKMMPEDVPGLLSAIATPTINVYTGRLDLSDMQLVAKEQVRDFTLFTQVLSSEAREPVDIPGSAVRLFAQVFDLRAHKGTATWTLTDAAFAGAELACDEFLGGLALRNQSGTAYAFILDGLKFGLQGEGRDAEPKVVADLHTTPSEEALPSLVISLQLAMNFMQAVLASPCTCAGAACDNEELRDFAAAGCEWFAEFIPPTTTDPELLALRVQALDLARSAQDPAYGAFVPLLEAERYESYVVKLLAYVQEIEKEIHRQQQAIAMRKQAELLIGMGEELNKNIIESGNLLKGLIQASRAQQRDLAEYYDSVITQLEAEVKSQSSRMDELEIGLGKARDEVDFRIQQYKAAVAQQQIADAIAHGLHVASVLFKVGAVIESPWAGTAALLDVAAQQVQKNFNVLKSLDALYSAGSNPGAELEDASKRIDQHGRDPFGNTSTLPWDELLVQFNAVMALGPQGEIVAKARIALEAAFEILVLRGKEVTIAQGSMNQIKRDIYTNRRQKELAERQAERLANLDTELKNPPEKLDRSAIDLVGLTGELYAVHKAMLTTLSSAFLLHDQALQYAYLQQPTVITSFSLLSFHSARVRQEKATQDALQALAPVHPSITEPISYEIEGVPVAEIHGGAGYQFAICLDAKEFYQYVTARVKAVVAEVEGVTGTKSGRFLVQLDYGGLPFADRNLDRDRLNFHTPSRRRTYEYNAETGDRLFTDEGMPWSENVSRITPFSTWTISLPNTQTNQDITFAGSHVTVRLLFVLEARIVDAPVRLRSARAGRRMRPMAMTPSDALAAAAPTTDALLRAMYNQGSCTNDWDVVFNMSLGQINKALRQQYEELKEDPSYTNTITTETRNHVQGQIYGIKKYRISYGYPVMTFMTNAMDTVKLEMEILADSSIQSCSQIGENPIECDPPVTIAGETMIANVKLSKVAGTVRGTDVLRVTLDMAKGAFEISNIDLSNDEQIEFNQALKSYFVNNPVEFLINELDITNIPTLDALKPNDFLFKTLKTPSSVEMLQLYIQTGGRPLLDPSQMSLNNVPEPLPDGEECSMMIRSELLFSEILPQSLQQNGWQMQGEGPPTEKPQGAWSGNLTKALVEADVDLSVMDFTRRDGPGGFGGYTKYSYEVEENPVIWSLTGIHIVPSDDGKLRMNGSSSNKMYYIETMIRKDCYMCPPWRKTEKHPTDVAIGVNVIMPLKVSGSGRDQQITIETSDQDVNVDGRMSGGGPCGNDDVEAKVNQQIRNQVPPQIASKLNIGFDSISVFALKNLLFPSDNFIIFRACFAPGDVLLVGKFKL